MNLSVKYYSRKNSNQSGREGFNLICSLHFQGKRLVYYTGLKFAMHEWDKANAQFRNSIDADLRNQYLHSLTKLCHKIFQSLGRKYGDVDPVVFRKELKRFKSFSGYSLSDAMVNFMELNMSNWSQMTFRKFKSLYLKLINYQEVVIKKFVALESVDNIFMNDFREYLIKSSLSESTVEVYMNQLKWFLTFALKKSWIINDDFRKYKNPGKISDDVKHGEPVFLYPSELNILNDYSDSMRKKEQIRDIFLFMCYSGCRFSEINNLKKSDFIGEKLRIEGKNKRSIPLNVQALEILKKYENRYFRHNSLFPVYSVITVNKYLKEIFTETGLNREIKISRRTVLMKDKLDKLVTVTLAYQTFMYLVVSRGISPVLIRKWSGNRTMNKYESMLDIIEKEKPEALISSNS